MSTSGAAVLDAAWALLDPGQSGNIDPGVLVSSFRARFHPWVLSGRVSASECLESFLANCSVGGELPGRATFKEFREYFNRAYPPSLVNDADFHAIVEAVWGVAGAPALLRSSFSPEAAVGPPPPPTLRRPVSSAPSPRSAGPDVVSAGLQPILARLRSAAAQGGPRAFVALGREVRPGATVKLAEFKAAVGAALGGACVAGRELRLLFDHFDPEGSGHVPFDALVDALKPPAALGPRRRNAVAAAFAALDPTQAGAVSAAAVVEAYRAAQHPDVLAGRTSDEAARAEFLDAFECGEVEGVVTLGEFLRYHLALPVENDDDFDVLLANTWGLHDARPDAPLLLGPPPLEAAPSNVAPVALPAPPPPPRVLAAAPHAPEGAPPRVRDMRLLEVPAGKLSIDPLSNHRAYDSLKDSVVVGQPLTTQRRLQPPAPPLAPARGPVMRLADAPPDALDGRREVVGRGDRLLAELPRHLQSCLAVTGHAVHDSKALSPASEAAGKRAGKMGGPGARLFGGSFNIFAAEDIQVPIPRAAAAPPPPPWAVQPPPTTTAASLAATQAPPPEAPDRELAAKVLQRLRDRLRDRGLKGCCDFGRELRARDESGEGLAEAALAEGLRAWGGSEVSPREAAALFRFLAPPRAGVLPVNHLMDGVYGAMPPRRASAVRAAFDGLLARAYPARSPPPATVDPAAAVRCFDPHGCPDARGAGAVLAEFLDTFECARGAVAWSDFRDYYQHLSFAVADDATFEGRVLGGWHATLPPAHADATNKVVPKEAAQRFGAMQGSVIFNTSYGPSEDVGRSIKTKVGRRQRDSPSYRSSIQFG